MQFLHTMIRVGDLEKSIQFYREVLGMTLLRQKDYPEGKFTLAFLGYGEEKNNTVLELTHNWEVSSYEQGSAFGHLAIGVEDVYAACEKIKQQGGTVVREAGTMKFPNGKYGKTILAFVEDPDGYKIELLTGYPS